MKLINMEWKKVRLGLLATLILCILTVNCGNAAPNYTKKQLWWLNHLVSQNNTRAMLQLTNYYYDRGEYKKALIYIHKGQKLGDKTLITALGGYYYNGLAGFPKDYKKAISYFKVGIAANVPPAFNMMGNAYAAGKGVNKNIHKAIKYYQKAIELGAVGAKYDLAVTIKYIDPILAFQLFEYLSSHSLDAQTKFDSMNQVALFTMYGVATKKNLPEAYKWFYIAATHGDKHAIKGLKIFSKDFTPDQKAEGKKLAEEYEASHHLK